MRFALRLFPASDSEPNSKLPTSNFQLFASRCLSDKLVIYPGRDKKVLNPIQLSAMRDSFVFADIDAEFFSLWDGNDLRFLIGKVSMAPPRGKKAGLTERQTCFVLSRATRAKF